MKTTMSTKMTKTMIENVPRKDKEIAGERGLLLIRMIRVARVEAKERENGREGIRNLLSSGSVDKI